MIVYISIGNSDDKLEQSQWSSFANAVDRAVDMATKYVGATVHGRWYSLPNEAWQNACWCVEFDDELGSVVDEYRAELARLAGLFRQDSIAWAEVKTTEFLGPQDAEVAS